jgi:hypothetical protein
LRRNKYRTKNKRNQKILIEMIFRSKEYVKMESRNIKKCLIRKKHLKQKEEKLKSVAQEKRKIEIFKCG